MAKNHPAKPERPARERDLIKDLEEGLLIDEHELHAALQMQPDFYYRVSKAYALLLSQRDEAKQTLQVIEAEVDVKLRREALENGDKVTEKEIESRKRIHRDVMAANDDLLTLNHKLGEVLALKEAYQQRSYVLKDLVALYIGNYYSDTTQQTSRNAMREYAGDSARRAMHEVRKQRAT